MPIEPVDVEDIVAIVMGMLVVLIPVAGLTARFALKPIAEAIAQMRASHGAQQQLQILEQRVALLEQQHQSMDAAVDQLVEEREFHRQLNAPRP